MSCSRRSPGPWQTSAARRGAVGRPGARWGGGAGGAARAQGRAGMPGARREARGRRRASSSAVSSFALAAAAVAVPPWLLFLLLSVRDFLPPLLACSFAAACQPHFLLLSCLPPAPSPPPAPLSPPTPPPPAGSPPSPRAPAASPPPALPPSGMSRSPPGERRAVGAGAPHLAARPHSPAVKRPGAERGQVRGPWQVQGAGALAREPYSWRSFIVESRLGAPGLSLLQREGAPLRGARKRRERWGCAAAGYPAPRAGRLFHAPGTSGRSRPGPLTGGWAGAGCYGDGRRRWGWRR